MTSIIIPSGVTKLNKSVCKYCSSLSDVTIKSPNKIFYLLYLFDGIASNAVLRVPSNLVDAYKADSNWSNSFKGGIVAIQ